MEMPNCWYRVSLKALIFDKARTKFLLAQTKSGKWELLGGGLDWGESPQEGLIREIKEEMGLPVVAIANTPAYFTTSKKEAGEYWVVNVMFETTLEHFNFLPSEECIAIRFVSSEEATELDLFTGAKVFLDVFNPANHI